jgi:hypothetical protein
MIKPPVEFDSFARSKEPNFVFDLRNGHMGHSFDLQNGVGQSLPSFRTWRFSHTLCRVTISFSYGETKPVRVMYRFTGQVFVTPTLNLL